MSPIVQEQSADEFDQKSTPPRRRPWLKAEADRLVEEEVKIILDGQNTNNKMNRLLVKRWDQLGYVRTSDQIKDRRKNAGHRRAVEQKVRAAGGHFANYERKREKPGPPHGITPGSEAKDTSEEPESPELVSGPPCKNIAVSPSANLYTCPKCEFHTESSIGLSNHLRWHQKKKVHEAAKDLQPSRPKTRRQKNLSEANDSVPRKKKRGQKNLSEANDSVPRKKRRQKNLSDANNSVPRKKRRKNSSPDVSFDSLDGDLTVSESSFTAAVEFWNGEVNHEEELRLILSDEADYSLQSNTEVDDGSVSAEPNYGEQALILEKLFEPLPETSNCSDLPTDGGTEEVDTSDHFSGTDNEYITTEDSDLSDNLESQESDNADLQSEAGPSWTQEEATVLVITEARLILSGFQPVRSWNHTMQEIWNDIGMERTLQSIQAQRKAREHRQAVRLLVEATNDYFNSDTIMNNVNPMA